MFENYSLEFKLKIVRVVSIIHVVSFKISFMTCVNAPNCKRTFVMFWKCSCFTYVVLWVKHAFTLIQISHIVVSPTIKVSALTLYCWHFLFFEQPPTVNTFEDVIRTNWIKQTPEHNLLVAIRTKSFKICVNPGFFLFIFVLFILQFKL